MAQTFFSSFFEPLSVPPSTSVPQAAPAALVSSFNVYDVTVTMAVIMMSYFVFSGKLWAWIKYAAYCAAMATVVYFTIVVFASFD